MVSISATSYRRPGIAINEGILLPVQHGASSAENGRVFDFDFEKINLA
jgi:hypothetical protein